MVVEWLGNVQRFRGGLAFKAHILVYRSTLGVRVTKKKKKIPTAISTGHSVEKNTSGC